MADLARHTPAPALSENIGDVLSSIRKLIAQDETGHGFPQHLTRRTVSLQDYAETVPEAVDAAADDPDTANDTAPLVLGHSEASVDSIDATQDFGPFAHIPAAEIPQAEPVLTMSEPKVEAVVEPVPTPVAPVLQQPVPSSALQEGATEKLNLFRLPQEEKQQDSLESPMRVLIRQALTQEFQGEFGDRFSLNLRNLIRSEISLVLKEAMRVA